MTNLNIVVVNDQTLEEQYPFRNYINSPIIRLTKPSSRQSFYGSTMEINAWCMLPEEYETPLLKEHISLKCFVAATDQFESVALHEIIYKGSEILPLSQWTISNPKQYYLSPDKKIWGFPLQISGILNLSYLDRSRNYNIFLQLELLGSVCNSNLATIYLGNKAEIAGKVHGGPLQILPRYIFSDQLILQSWALECDHKISSVETIVKTTESKIEHIIKRVYTEIDLSGNFSALPDIPEYKKSGIETIIQFDKNFFDGKDYQDISIHQTVLSTSGKIHEFLLGLSRVYNKTIQPVYISSVKTTSDFVEISGCLSRTADISDVLVIKGKGREVIIPLSHDANKFCKDGFELSWSISPNYPLEFGSVSLSSEDQFYLKISTDSINSFGDRFSLSKKSSSGTIILLEDSFLSQFNFTSSQKNKGLLIPLINSFKNALNMHSGLTNHNETLKNDYLKPSPDSSGFKEEKNLHFFMHSFSATEGAPIVASNIIKSLSEVSTNNLQITGFLDGDLKSDLLPYATKVSLRNEGSMYSQSTNRYLNLLSELVAGIKRDKTSLVLANGLDAFIAIDAANRSLVPSVWIIHESVDPGDKYREHGLKIRTHFLSALRNASRIVFVSETTRKLYSDLIDFKQTVIIPNGIDQKSFNLQMDKYNRTNEREMLGIDSDTKVFLSVGTICERKGQERTLAEFVQFREKFPEINCKLVLVGARPMPFLELVKKMIIDLALVDHVILIPETKEVHRYYKLADAFVINSREESFPLVVLEAFAAGLPVISTNVYGLGEILINETNALLFDGDKKGQLADLMYRIINDCGLSDKLSQGALNSLKAKYTLEATISQYKQTIRDCFFSKN
ncbi:MAG TPA: glycosyltransferase family 4 protein [Oligoflexia bacterium]|nr:glycosyltransferase family 4 protein [Oligoflexia bacterium]HMP47691.1 glycosyltransferase family 4 protein [Oligoflexia bacterium]